MLQSDLLLIIHMKIKYLFYYFCVINLFFIYYVPIIISKEYDIFINLFPLIYLIFFI